MSVSQLGRPMENGMEYQTSVTSSDLKRATPVAMVAPELKQPDIGSEITKTCAVFGCEDYKHLEEENFFPFPEDPKQRQLWMELTGRSNWTPTDYSYICIRHFSVDSFVCDANNDVVLVDKAVPCLKLPRHVLEVEYIEEELESEDETQDEDTDDEHFAHQKVNGQTTKVDNTEILKLFTEVQKMQRNCVGLKDKLRCNVKLHNQQTRYLQRLKDTVAIKRKLIDQKNKKKARILLSLQEKIKDDKSGLVLAMPTKHTDDLKNFALSIYRYSPQSYVFVRNTLRTMLPSTDVLESWLNTGCKAKYVMSNSSSVKIVAEQTPSELSCKVSIH